MRRIHLDSGLWLQIPFCWTAWIFRGRRYVLRGRKVYRVAA
jgi:hypothetical protein